MTQDDHVQRATKLALGIFSIPVTAAAKESLDAVKGRTRDGALAEASADVRALRDMPRLSRTVAQLRAEAFAVVHSAVLGAMQDAFASTGMAEAKDAGLSFELSDDDKASLLSFPVVAATAGEHADRLAADAVWRVRSVVTLAAIGALPQEGVAAAMAEEAAKWADTVGRIVGDAWQSGITAARMAMADALRDHA